MGADDMSAGTMEAGRAPQGLAQAPQGLISRVAECCFWFGRYVERAEAVARALEATMHLDLDGELSPLQCWRPMVIVSGEEERYAERFGEDALGDAEGVQRCLVWDDECVVSVRQSVTWARENARAVRDVIPSEAWEAINELHLWLGSAEARASYDHQRDAFYRRVRQATQLTLATVRSTMLRDAPLDFIGLGVLLERTNQTARLLDVHHHAFAKRDEADEAHQVVRLAAWVALLKALSGYEGFMKSSAGRVSAEGVAAFLISDARFPRSLAYCLQEAHARFCALRPPQDAELPGAQTSARLEALRAWVVGLPMDLAPRGGLHAVLTHVVDETSAIANLLGQELLGAIPDPEAALEPTPPNPEA
jgi:uncharacterized alpha-E superfamily protein